MTSASGSTDNANIVAPAPVFYSVAFVLGLAANHFFPIPIMPGLLAVGVGALLLLISIPIAISAIFQLRKAGTAFDAAKTSTVLVTKGMYSHSRNPVYLSLTLLFTSIAFLVNSLFVLLAVPLAIICTQFAVIRPEERYLSEKFGDTYHQYKKKVRQWL